MKKKLIYILVYLGMSSSIYAGWNSEFDTDPMTDKKFLMIWSDNFETMIGCSPSQWMDVRVWLPHNESYKLGWTQIQYRFDSEPANWASFRINPDPSVEGPFMENGVHTVSVNEEFNEKLDWKFLEVRFIKNMIEKSRLLLRVPTEKSYVDVEVDLNGISEHLNPNLEFCGIGL